MADVDCIALQVCSVLLLIVASADFWHLIHLNSRSDVQPPDASLSSAMEMVAFVSHFCRVSFGTLCISSSYIITYFRPGYPLPSIALQCRIVV